MCWIVKQIDRKLKKIISLETLEKTIASKTLNFLISELNHG